MRRLLLGGLVLAALAIAAVSLAPSATADTSRSCDSLNTICANAQAIPKVSCKTIFSGSTAFCKGGGTVGGGGSSPAGLPGDASWSGTVECGSFSDCSDNPKHASGGCSWSGTNGCSTQKSRDLDGESNFQGCVEYSVVASSSSSADLDFVGRSESTSVRDAEFKTHCWWEG